MFFTINIQSKNLKSLNKFLMILNNENFFKKLHIKFFKIMHKSNKTKKVLTILKSPHVNKSAQEQFEHITYKKNVICFSEQPFLFILVLKSLRFKHFSDISVLIKFNSDTIKAKTILKNNIDFLFLKLNPEKKNHLIEYLKMIELNGEFLINKCLNSSVG